MTDVFFEVWVEKGVFVARLVGETRMPRVPASEVGPMFEEHLRSGGSADVIFDLNQAAYLSSWCLAVIIKSSRASPRTRGRRIICNFQNEILEHFEYTRLLRSFVFCEDLAAALAFLSTGDNDPPSGFLMPSNG